LSHFIKTRSLIFIISDFLIPSFSEELKTLTKKHEVMLVHCFDDAEKGSSLKGIYEAQDPETGETYLLDGNSPKVRSRLLNQFTQNSSYLEQLARETKSDYLPLSIQDDYLQRVVRHFNSRGAIKRQSLR
jgi:CTP:phosphocholine cytidylyltransferase-like protein